MKKTLLATVAAMALLGGTGLALSEGMNQGSEQRSPSAAPSTSQQPSAQQPAAQPQPGMERGGRTDRGAQREPSQPRGSAQQERREQAPRGAQQRERERGTTGQGAQERTQDRPDRQDRQPGARDRDREGQSPRNSEQSPDRRGPAGAQTENRGGAKALSTEQKTRIRTTVINRAPKVTNVNFQLSVGTVVPRTVQFVAVPAPLIEIYPEWRGYSYFVVGDEIVIVDPATMRIIAVLDV